MGSKLIQRTKLLLVKQLNTSPGLTPDRLPVPLDYWCREKSSTGASKPPTPPDEVEVCHFVTQWLILKMIIPSRTHISLIWHSEQLTNPYPFSPYGRTKCWEGSSHKSLQPVLWFIQRKKKSTLEKLPSLPTESTVILAQHPANTPTTCIRNGLSM